MNKAWGNGRGGRPWRRLRGQILERDQFLCQVCKRKGRITEATQVERSGKAVVQRMLATSHR